MIARTIEQIHYKGDDSLGEEILRTEKLSGKGFEEISVRVRAGR